MSRRLMVAQVQWLERWTVPGQQRTSQVHNKNAACTQEKQLQYFNLVGIWFLCVVDCNTKMNNKAIIPSCYFKNSKKKSKQSCTILNRGVCSLQQIFPTLPRTGMITLSKAKMSSCKRKRGLQRSNWMLNAFVLYHHCRWQQCNWHPWWLQQRFIPIGVEPMILGNARYLHSAGNLDFNFCLTLFTQIKSFFSLHQPCGSRAGEIEQKSKEMIRGACKSKKQAVTDIKQ